MFLNSHTAPGQAGLGRTDPLAKAEFTTLRQRLLKIAARVIETASRVRVAFAATCPEAALFRGLVRALQPIPP